MADVPARHVGKAHPVVEGRTVLARAFGGRWQTAEAIARSLGYEVSYHSHGGVNWSLVPHQAVGEIAAAFVRWGEEQQEARSTKDRVSCKILDAYLHFQTAHFARKLCLELTRPADGEEEYFVRPADIPAIIAAARESDPIGPGWRTEPGIEDAALRWIEERRLIGMTEREAKERKRRVDASKGPSHSAASWPPY